MTRAIAVAIAIELLAERSRQMDGEGYSSAHDDAHDRAELALAAAARATEAAAQAMDNPAHDLWGSAFRLWPFGDFAEERRKDPRRCLVIAGALILAEIERLDRAAFKAKPAFAKTREGRRDLL